MSECAFILVRGADDPRPPAQARFALLMPGMLWLILFLVLPGLGARWR